MPRTATASARRRGGGRTLAVLHPAIAEAARRVGADAVGLVDVGRGAGLNLNVACAGISYSDGRALGDPASAVQVACAVVGDRPVPARALPEVVARVAAGTDLLDVTDPEATARLRAGIPSDRAEEVAVLDAELAALAADPPTLVPGAVVEVLGDALARVPAPALPVVITTWALADLDVERRLRFLRRLDEHATDRPVAWVSVEGVGVAPGVPTLGDRPASGHSIVGLAVARHTTLHAEALGRCWSRGRWLAWLAEP